MDVSYNFASVRVRQAVQRVDRVAGARVQQRRLRAPVDDGRAATQDEDREPVSPNESAAAFNRIREKDVGHLIDLVV